MKLFKISFISIISILLISSPVIGQVEEVLPASGGKGLTLYLWKTYSGSLNKTKSQWKYFGDNKIHHKYVGEVENGVPNGLGILTSPWDIKWVGEWKDGQLQNGKKYDRERRIIRRYLDRIEYF